MKCQAILKNPAEGCLLQLETSRSALVADLRADLERSDEKLKESIARENALQADVNEAKKEIRNLLGRLDMETRNREEQQ